ncbi:MAG: hypothetical protein GEU26_12745 [Nitrososphaeraceae archaeon]|nr:hypothetical protein [Nitrososphaeraceae archaeon]
MSTSDSIAIVALIISTITACATAIALSFNIWHTSRTRRSEELKVARELMNRIWDGRKVLDDYYERYIASPPKNEELKIRAYEWANLVGDLIYEIEGFRAYVITGEIKNRTDVELHKIRIFVVLQRIENLRNLIPIEPKEPKDVSDRWIVELKKWCREGNEGRLPVDTR